MMTKYSKETKEEIRKVFYEQLPRFAFPITVKPLSRLNVVNVRKVIHICESLQTYCFIFKKVEAFIRNLSEDPYHENLCAFEAEIVHCEAFNTLLFMVDIHYDIFERTAKIYTWEYLRQEEIITYDNAESFVEVVFLQHVTIRDDLNSIYSNSYGDYKREADFILSSHQHKIVVLRQHCDHLEISLDTLMAHDFKDYDIQKATLHELESNKMTLPDDFEQAKNLLRIFGLKNFDLPPYIYEVESIS